jgi:hypothetical protein
MADLRTLHQELFAALAELEALTTRPEFDEAVLSGMRYRLTRISGARRRMVAALCDGFLAEGKEIPGLRALRDSNLASRSASTSHIGTWSLRDVTRDWQGYCRASAGMRATMRQQVEQEKAVLYPHLADAQLVMHG